MAQSRLERIGTVYTRIISLLKGKAMKKEDKPLWISVYATFPPTYEPRFDRELPKKNIRPIFYKEDHIRAKFHKDQSHQSFIPATDMTKENEKSATQKFLSVYNSIEKQEEKLNKDDVYQLALQQYNSEMGARMESRKVEEKKI